VESENKGLITGEAGYRPPRARTNRDWWPNQLELGVLHQNPPAGDPMGADFDYAAEFNSLDLDALKADIVEVMTTSQDWWPADYATTARCSSG
jgi:catalase-peroxidase